MRSLQWYKRGAAYTQTRKFTSLRKPYIIYAEINLFITYNQGFWENLFFLAEMQE